MPLVLSQLFITESIVLIDMFLFNGIVLHFTPCEFHQSLTLSGQKRVVVQPSLVKKMLRKKCQNFSNVNVLYNFGLCPWEYC